MRFTIPSILFFLIFFGLHTPTFATSFSQIQAPTLVFQTVSPKEISFSYINVPTEAKLYLVDRYNQKPYLLTAKRKVSSGVTSAPLPAEILTGGISSQYRLEARNASGNILAASEYAQIDDAKATTPNCTLKSSAYTVKAGKDFVLSWSSPESQYAVRMIGFSALTESSHLANAGSIKLNSDVTGLKQFSFLFSGFSGQQSFCTVYINVTGKYQSGTIDDKNLSGFVQTPKLSGTATNVKKVMVSISDHEKAGGEVWSSGPITVRKGKWSTQVSPALPYSNYVYTVALFAYSTGQPKQLTIYKNLVVK